MHLNPFAISNLLIILTCFPLATCTLIYGKTRVSKFYSLHCLCVGIWGLGGFFAAASNSPATSLFWWKIGCSGVAFIPILFLHTIFLLTANYNKQILLFSYFQGFVFLISILSGTGFKKVKFMFDSLYYAQGGVIFFIFFIFWFCFVFLGHYLLIKFIINKKEKNYLFFLVSTLVGFSGGIMNFLPAFGINLYPFANFLIPFYFLVISYAILKYQILDIEVVIQKGFIYSLLIAFITAAYFILVFLAEKLFQGMVGYTSLIISIIYAFVIALLFTPVKNKLQHFADKIFLGKDPMQIARENELMKQELEHSERLKAVAHFASGMAHEIKNPLTAIKTFTEYLPEKIHDAEFLKKFADIISGEVERIDNLVHNLLDFAKPSPLKLEDVDIHKLLDETLELLSNDFLKHKIEINKDYSDEKLITLIDANRMKQAFLNLILNAIDAMPSGGILSIQTNHCNQDSIIVITVKDTGSGIAEKDLKHIFEPFFSKKEAGTGLGLSIVYNIIKEHKGKIKVESKVGEGTRFIIELPKKENRKC